MREIKFRGKIKSETEWAYGDLRQHEDGRTMIGVNIGKHYALYLVDRETVGQYVVTVLDSDFHENDLIETRHRIYDDGKPRLNLLVNEDLCWKLKAINDDKASTIPLSLYLKEPESIKLVGNRWDNPNLIGG